MAADESTISWGPSPTFGELVSRHPAGGGGTLRGEHLPGEEEVGAALLLRRGLWSCMIFGSH